MKPFSPFPFLHITRHQHTYIFLLLLLAPTTTSWRVSWLPPDGARHALLVALSFFVLRLERLGRRRHLLHCPLLTYASFALCACLPPTYSLSHRAVPNVSTGLRAEFARGDGRVKRKEDERKKVIAPSETLFVVNFNEAKTKREDLQMLFEPFGELLRIDMKKNYAFVQFRTIEQATKAKTTTDGGKLDQSVITVEYVARQRDFGGDRRGERSASFDRRRRMDDRRRGPPPDRYDRRYDYDRYDDRYDDRYRRRRPRSRSRSRSPPPRYYRDRSPPSAGSRRYETPPSYRGRRSPSPYDSRSRRSPEYDRGYRS